MCSEKKSILLLQKEYVEMLNDLKNIKISLPTKETSLYQADNQFLNMSTKLLVPEEGIKSYTINPRSEYLANRPIFAYDESIIKYNCLEGTGYHTAHSLIYLEENDFIPMGLLTFYFYTASEMISKQASFIKLTEDIEMDSKKDYVKNKYPKISIRKKKTDPI